MRNRLAVLASFALIANSLAACSSDKSGTKSNDGGAGGSAASSGGGSNGGAAGSAQAGAGGSGVGAGGASTGGANGADGSAPDGGPGAKFDHVFVIMMENHGTDEIIGNAADAPYINQLAGQYGVATNYYGVTHPSLPNYLAAISGDFQGIFDDCKAGQTVTCAPEEFVSGSGDPTSAVSLTADEVTTATAKAHWFDGQNLVDQLEAAHLTWKAYMQGLPAVGNTDEYAPVSVVDGGSVPRKLYAQKHNPFDYFSDIRNSTARMNLVVPFTGFATDVAGDMPNFVWISPDQCHDMHGISTDNANAVGIPDCAAPASGLDHSVIKLGDDFLKDTVQKIMASPAWRGDSAIAIVWDEDDYSGYAGCCGSPTGQGGTVLGGARAPALVITSKNAKHQSTDTSFNHYSLLGTIEQGFGLGCLANACGRELMTKLFRP